jgi:hypothetical protein
MRPRQGDFIEAGKRKTPLLQGESTPWPEGIALHFALLVGMLEDM